MNIKDFFSLEMQIYGYPFSKKKKSCNQAVIVFFLFSLAVHSYRWLCIFTEILATLILARITEERLLLF